MKKIKNVWYYFKADGVMATGWQKIGNKWYYLKESGAMTTGWQKVGNMWYYMNGSGGFDLHGRTKRNERRLYEMESVRCVKSSEFVQTGGNFGRAYLENQF